MPANSARDNECRRSVPSQRDHQRRVPEKEDGFKKKVKKKGPRKSAGCRGQKEGQKRPMRMVRRRAASRIRPKSRCTGFAGSCLSAQNVTKCKVIMQGKMCRDPANRAASRAQSTEHRDAQTDPASRKQTYPSGRRVATLALEREMGRRVCRAEGAVGAEDDLLPWWAGSLLVRRTEKRESGQGTKVWEGSPRCPVPQPSTTEENRRPRAKAGLRELSAKGGQIRADGEGTTVRKSFPFLHSVLLPKK